MQKSGYIEIKNTNDEKIISLTPAGKQFAQKSMKREKEIFDTLSEDVSKEDMEIFNKVINQLVDKAEKLTNSARSEV